MNYANWQTKNEDIHQHHQSQQHHNNLTFRSSESISVNDKSPIMDASSGIETTTTDPELSRTSSNSKYNPKQISSFTKRAEQNRNAQRAFRQRREKYVQDLEKKVQEMDELKAKNENLNNENVQLKDYVMILQRKIIELTQGKDLGHHDHSLSDPFSTK
ncbi:Cap4 transcriptional regulator with bZip domain [Candida orthopsilosis Co 90-125]|uniref:Putative transcription factor kapC n=1 Tax=Candida orthopsilosis (strain 90-125) TaxID=1136231 RepID=H8WXG0_CANO9|nr:Cap4 transcriptional regulator with bZip domain [Candida orthopsilosis Co 90-125]CCG21466.1 Cap4 transcriptional regulator with bZip domain [Candida orthopsilosis Co 90-125]